MQITKIKHLYQRLRRQLFSHVHLARYLFIGLLLLTVSIGWTVIRRPAENLINSIQIAAGKPLPENNGRTNILLLGSGGSGHEGPDLSDTMILASIKLSTGEVSLLSIPRDIWVPSMQAKINTAYHYGYLNNATSGGLLNAKAAVHEITGQPIHFALNVDFSTFSKTIDLLGGIDVVVDREFTDNEYPISGRENDLCDGDPAYKCRFETIHFKSGLQKMDGITALKYARSRHSTDPDEGTDYARSKRQEKIIIAIKLKLSSVKNLTNTKLFKDLYNLLVSSVVTDIGPEFYATFLKLGLQVYNQPFQTFTLSEPDQLENPPLSDKYQGQWVLIPKNGNRQIVFDYVSSLFK